jgi:hypothetical protein
MFKKFLCWTLILQHLNIYVLQAAPGDLRVSFDEEPIVASKVSSPSSRRILKVSREDQNGQFQNILSRIFDVDRNGNFSLKDSDTTTQGFRLRVENKMISLSSKQANDQFVMYFKQNGSAKLGELNTTASLSLRTFGDIITGGKVKSQALELAGKSFSNNHMLDVRNLALDLGHGGTQGKFTNAEAAQLIIGNQAHVYQGTVINQGRIVGKHASTLNLHGNNFQNENIGQNGKGGFGCQLNWEGQFSVINVGTFLNKTKIISQSQVPNSKLTVSADFFINDQSGVMSTNNGFDIQGLKAFSNLGLVSTRVLSLATAMMDNAGRIEISQQGRISGYNLVNREAGSIKFDGSLEINGTSIGAEASRSDTSRDYSGPQRAPMPLEPMDIQDEAQSLYGSFINEGRMTGTQLNAEIDLIKNNGVIEAKAPVTLLANELSTGQDSVLSSREDLSIQGLTRESTNRGLIDSDAHLILRSQSKFHNLGGLKGHSTAVSVDELDNRAPIHALGGALTINASRGENKSIIKGEGDVNLAVHESFSLEKLAGYELAQVQSRSGSVTLSGDGTVTNHSYIQAFRDVQLQSTLINFAKIESATGDVNSATVGLSLTNEATGQILAAQAVALTNDDIILNKGLMQGNKTSITSTHRFCNTGTINAVAGGAQYNIQDGENKGVLRAGGKLDFNVSGSFENLKEMLSPQEIDIYGRGAFFNRESGTIGGRDSIVETANVLIRNNRFTNEGKLAAQNRIDLAQITDSFNNEITGLIQSLNQIKADQVTSLTNKGQIQSDKKIDLDLARLSNSGTVVSQDTTVKVGSGENTQTGKITGMSKLELQSQGEFVNDGDCVSEESIRLAGQGRLTNSKLLTAKNIHSDVRQILNTGNVVSTEDIAFGSHTALLENESTGRIYSGRALSADGISALVNKGFVISEKDQNLTVTDLKNEKDIYSVAGDISLALQTGSNSGIVSSTKAVNIHLSGQNPFLNTASGRFLGELLKVDGTQGLENLGLMKGNAHLLYEAGPLRNSGTITSDRKIEIKSDFCNKAQGDDPLAAAILSHGELILRSTVLAENSGHLFGKTGLTGQFMELKNTGVVGCRDGEVTLALTKGSNDNLIEGKTLSMTIAEAFANNKFMQAQEALTLQGQGLLTNTGNIGSDGSLTLRDLPVTNFALIEAKGDLELAGNVRLTNALGATTSSDVNINIAATSALLGQGTTLSKGTFTLNQAVITNEGKIQSTRDVSFPNCTSLDNQSTGTVTSTEGQLLLPHLKKFLNAGDVSSAGALNLLNLTEFNNTGNVGSKDVLTVTSQSDITNSGKLLGLLGLKVHAQAGHHLTNSGQMDSDEKVEAKGTNLTNSGKVIGKKGAALEATGTLVHEAGALLQNLEGLAKIKAAEAKISGKINAQNASVSSSSKPLTLATDQITVNDLTTLTAPHGWDLQNQKKEFLGNLDLTGPLLNKGHMRINGNFTWHIPGSFTNTTDLIVDGLAKFTLPGLFTNNSRFEAGNGTNLSALGFINNGSFFSTRTTTFTLGQSMANAGNIELHGAVQFNIGGSLSNKPNATFVQKEESQRQSTVNIAASLGVVNESAKMYFQSPTKFTGSSFVNKELPRKNEDPAKPAFFSAFKVNFEVDHLKNLGSTLTASKELKFKGSSLANLTRNKTITWTDTIYIKGSKKGKKHWYKHRKRSTVAQNIERSREEPVSPAKLISAETMSLRVNGKNIDVTAKPHVAKKRGKGRGRKAPVVDPIAQQAPKAINNTGEIKAHYLDAQAASLYNGDSVYGAKHIGPVLAQQLADLLPANYTLPHSFWIPDQAGAGNYLIKANKPILMLADGEYQGQLQANAQSMILPEAQALLSCVQEMQERVMGRTLAPFAMPKKQVVGLPGAIEFDVTGISSFSSRSLRGISPFIAVLKDSRLSQANRHRQHMDPMLQADLIMDYFIASIGHANLYNGIYSPELQSRILDILGYINGKKIRGQTLQPEPQNWDTLTPKEQLAQQGRVEVSQDELTKFESPGTVYKLIESLGELVLTPIVVLPAEIREKFKTHVGARIAAQLLGIKVDEDLSNIRGEFLGGVAKIVVDGVLKNSGAMKAGILAVEAGVIDAETMVVREQTFAGYRETLDREATFEATEQHLTVHGRAAIQSKGALFEGEQDAFVDSAGPALFASQVTSVDETTGTKKKQTHVQSQTHHKTRINSKTGDVGVHTTGDLFFNGCDKTAEKSVNIRTEADEVCTPVYDTVQVTTTKKKNGNVFKGKKTQKSSSSSETVVANRDVARQGDISNVAKGNHTQQASEMKSGGKTQLASETKNLKLLAAKTTVTKSSVKDKKSSFWVSHKDESSIDETLKLVEIEAKGGVELTAPKRIVIEEKMTSSGKAKGKPKAVPVNSKTSYIDEYRNKPNVDIVAVKEVHEHHKHKTSSIGPAAAALIAIAVAVCTAGAGLAGVVGTALAGTEVMASAATIVGMSEVALVNAVAGAVEAGFTCVASKATISAVSNKGNFKKIGKDLTSKATLATLALTMLSAGVADKVCSTAGVNSMDKGFAKTLATHMTKSTTTSVLSMPLQGVKPKDALESALRNGLSGAVGEHFSGEIGGLRQEEVLGTVAHKLGHLFVGAAGGAIGSKDLEGGALAGAFGAAGAEILAECLSGYAKEQVQEQVVQEALDNGGITKDRVHQIELAVAKDVADVSKLLIASAAALLELDVDTVARTADAALTNNWLQFGCYAVMGGMTVYAAYDIYDTYKTEGAEAALIKAGVEVVMTYSGAKLFKAGFKIAGKFIPMAEAETAWLAYMETSPVLKNVVIKAEAVAGKTAEWVCNTVDAIGTTRVGKAMTKAGGAITDSASAVKNKVAGWFGKEAPEVVVPKVIAYEEAKAVEESVSNASEVMKVVRGKDGKVKGVTGTQDHHIIHEKLKEHELWRLAGEDPQARANKMLLPTKKGKEVTTTHRSVHQGRHTDASRAVLEEQMDRIEIKGKVKGWSSDQYKAELKQIIQEERRLLKNGRKSLYKDKE